MISESLERGSEDNITVVAVGGLKSQPESTWLSWGRKIRWKISALLTCGSLFFAQFSTASGAFVKYGITGFSNGSGCR